MLVAAAAPDVRVELESYGLTEAIGADSYFETVSEATEKFRLDAAESG